jgi:hypothetical protein
MSVFRCSGEKHGYNNRLVIFQISRQFQIQNYDYLVREISTRRRRVAYFQAATKA